MFARTPRLLLRPGFPEDAPALAGVAIVPDADRVQHRRDAGADDLRIVRQHGCDRRGPKGVRARLEMLLHVVGMDLDQARQQEIAFQVLAAADGARILHDLNDSTALDAHRAVDDRISRHHPRIAQDQSAAHPPGSGRVARPGGDR